MGLKLMNHGMVLLFVWLLLLWGKTHSAHITGNILTNDIIEYPDETPYHGLSPCRSGSSCGYLQVNAFGVNKHQFCACATNGGACPMHWDGQDGHSVTMGDQQYKFCGSAPVLHVCNAEETAYTSAYLLDQETYAMVGDIQTLHCYCPAPRSHIRQGSTDDVLDSMFVFGTVHTCNKLPICEETTACKEVSIGSTSLVTRKCQCPRGTVCPTLSSQARRSNDMNQSFENGKAFSIYCEPWF